MISLNYLWRLMATGLSFAIFGLGGLVLSFLIIPVIQLISTDNRQKKLRSRKLIHNCFRGFMQIMSVLGVVDFDIMEAKRILVRHRGNVVIANHPTLIDVVVLISIIPDADCIIKEELWNNKYIKRVLQAAGYIKNTENIPYLIKACQASLNEGSSLIIFPEGTRTKKGEDIVLQRGASNIALRCMVDMVPVLIRCEPSTLTKHEKWYRIPENKISFSLQVHEPFKISGFGVEGQSLSIKARHLTAHINSYYNETMKSYG